MPNKPPPAPVWATIIPTRSPKFKIHSSLSRARMALEQREYSVRTEPVPESRYSYKMIYYVEEGNSLHWWSGAKWIELVKTIPDMTPEDFRNIFEDQTREYK